MLKRFAPILTLTALCWVVYLADRLLCHGHLSQHGITPRHLAGLPAILWAPLLHSSLRHLAANTLPLLFLGGILCARSQAQFALVAAAGTLLGGALTWLLARNASHIGASGLVFCLFGYLASLALFNRTLGTLVLSVVCLLAYGGILRGVLPTAAPISWESHAAGLAAGLALAWVTAKVKKTSQAPGPRLPAANPPGP